jgi:hypothetical protein
MILANSYKKPSNLKINLKSTLSSYHTQNKFQMSKRLKYKMGNQTCIGGKKNPG